MSRRRRRSDLRIFLTDQCRSIGTGWRGVQIVKVGRLWVRFRETSSCRLCRLARKEWERLAAHAYRETAK